MKEREIDNHNNLNRSYSLAPTTNAEDMNIYTPIIESLLREKEENCKKLKNKNIAIIGGYGAGKSSVISSYFKGKDDVLYVSLGSYIERTSNKRKTAADEMDRIETSILQQIIYSVNPQELPFSRISRIDFDFKRKNIINTLFAIILSLIVIVLFEIKNYETLLKVFKSRNIIIVFSFFSSFIWIIIRYFLNIITSSTFHKIKINGVEVTKEESDISILNRNIDELIHFFQMTKFNIVIYEDIDRLNNCREVFSKLKEINIIINNAIENKTIQFLYAVGDTIFKSTEERTKFFDGIIPIIPYTGTKVSIDLFKSKEYDDYNFDDDILKIICRYVDNSRIARNILTEYSIFYEILKKNSRGYNKMIKSDRNMLLVLCSYKVLYPKKYNLLLNDKGKLAFYLSKEFEEKVKEIIIKSSKDTISTAKGIKKTTRGFSIDFSRYIIEYIKSRLNENNTLPINILKEEDNSIICKFDNLETLEPKDLDVILNNKIKIEYSDRVMSEIDFNKIIYKDDLVNLLKFSKLYYNKEDLEESIQENQKNIDEFNMNQVDIKTKINILDSITNEDLGEKYGTANENIKYNDKDIELNQFEKWIIQSDIIDITYKRLIINNHGIEYTPKDNELIKEIEHGERIKYDADIDNPKNVLEEISKYDFENNSICIKKLFLEIRKNPNSYNEHIDIFFRNLDNDKLDFLIKLEEDEKGILSIYKKHSDELVDYIKSSNLVINNKGLLISRIVSANKTPTIKVLEFVKDYIENIDEIEKIYTKYSKNFNPNLACYNIDFKQTKFCSYQRYKSFYTFIDKFEMLNFNINLIESFSRVMNYKYKKDKVLESIYSNDDDNNIKKMFEKDFKKTIEMINNSKIPQKNNEKFLSEYISKHNLNDIQIELLMKNEEIKIKDISKIGHYEILKNSNKIYPSFYNLNILYNYNNKKLDNYIIDSIITNIESLTSKKIEYKSYETFINELLYSPEINIDIFKKIIDVIPNDYLFQTLIPEISIEKNKYLITSNRMYNNDGQYIHILDIVNNDNLDDYEKLIYLKNSFKTIKNQYYTQMDTKVLNYLIKINIERKKALIDYIYQYKKIFDSITYQNIFGIALTNDINISKEDVITLIKMTSAIGINKLKMFLKYYEIVSDKLVELLPYFGEDYNRIIVDTKRKSFPRTDENEKLARILENQEIIDHTDYNKRRIYIVYNSKRNSHKK